MATAIKEERCVYEGIEPEKFTNSDNAVIRGGSWVSTPRNSSTAAR